MGWGEEPTPEHSGKSMWVLTPQNLTTAVSQCASGAASRTPHRDQNSNAQVPHITRHGRVQTACFPHPHSQLWSENTVSDPQLVESKDARPGDITYGKTAAHRRAPQLKPMLLTVNSTSYPAAFIHIQRELQTNYQTLKME